ncbi:hypothetical protein ACFQX6_14780 [Streptosporangium lutulentum]
MTSHPAALQLRLLQTVVEVAAEKNSTLVLPFPVELLRFLERSTPPEVAELFETDRPAETVEVSRDDRPAEPAEVSEAEQDTSHSIPAPSPDLSISPPDRRPPDPRVLDRRIASRRSPDL